MILNLLSQTRHNIRDGLFATLSGIFVTSFSLILLGTFILVYLNVMHMTRLVFKQTNYSIFLKGSVDDRDKWTVINRVKEIDGADNIRVLSPDEVKEELITSFGDTAEVMRKIDLPVFPNIVEFSLNRSSPLSLSDLRGLKHLTGVDEVISGMETRDQINVFFNIAEFVGIFLIWLLVFSIVLIIHNSIRLAIRMRAKEIEIYKILGATPGYIRAPFILEGLLIAIASYLVSLGVIYFLYQFVIAGITFNESTYSIRESALFFNTPQLILFFALVSILGLISALLATNKMLEQIDE